MRTLHLSQSWPRSHDLLSPVLCSLVCSCTLPLRIRTLRVSKHRSLVPTLGLSPAFPIPGGHSSRQRLLSKLSEADNIREAFWEIPSHFIGHWSHKDISLVTSLGVTSLLLSSNKADVLIVNNKWDGKKIFVQNFLTYSRVNILASSVSCPLTFEFLLLISFVVCFIDRISAVYADSTSVQNLLGFINPLSLYLLSFCRDLSSYLCSLS